MAPWWSRPTAEGAEEGPEKPHDKPAAELPASTASPPAAGSQLAMPGLPPPAVPSAPTPDSPPPSRAPAAAVPTVHPPPVLTGEGEELPSGEEPGSTGEARETAGAEATLPERRRRRRNGRGRGGGGVVASPASPTAEPRPAAQAVEPPARLRPLREGQAREEVRSSGAQREGETLALGVPQLQEMIREIVTAVPDRATAAYEERKLAVFCDLENVAIGSRDTGITFDINLVLERLLEKGKIIVKKAYADWSRYGDYKRPFHEAGIELIDIPQRSYSGKNSADIKMVVDAMDLSYAKEHLDTFVLLSGDSDFSPLVSKLKENDKYVIGVGVKGSSSSLLIDSCDEFIYYEDIWRDVERVPHLETLPKKEQEVFGLLIEAILALTRENKDVLWGSMIKQTMQRKRPSFNEGYFGYSTFSELLEDAERKNILKLKKDQRSGSYIVTGFARRR